MLHSRKLHKAPNPIFSIENQLLDKQEKIMQRIKYIKK